MSKLLDDLIGQIKGLPGEELAELEEAVLADTEDMCWFPTPGPQTEAYFCEADELFYGGSAGGGKTDLGLGLALTAHTNCLLLRRINKDARALMDRVGDILGHTEGRNLSLLEWNVGERKLDFGGCQYEKDKERYKGIPHDFIHFDEVADFLKSQVMFIKTWNRSTIEGQRCRVLFTGNPPTTPEGLWIIEYFAPWLDPKHPNPAKEGELRWFITDANDKEIEVDGPGPHTITYDDGRSEQVRARSRTFIRARLQDNPYLMRTDYGATLDALPAELRAAYRDGRFDASIKDNPWQIIPTSWIHAAQKRWKPTPPPGVPMCAMGVDPAQGGDDNSVIASRYDGWYAPNISVPGKQTPLGSDVAALVIAKRRDGALPVVDMGGGYGGGVIQTLSENNIAYYAYKGSERATGRTKDGKLKFKNKRTEAYWRFREALDPDQPGGSPISLPDNPRLVADLAAVTFRIINAEIVAESKEDVVDRLGRSPDDGDAVIMAWVDGAKAVTHANMWGKSAQPGVVMGHQNQRRRR